MENSHENNPDFFSIEQDKDTNNQAQIQTLHPSIDDEILNSTTDHIEPLMGKG